MPQPLEFNDLNLPFVEALYDRYLSSPEELSPEWRKYFETLNGSGTPNAYKPTFKTPGLFGSNLGAGLSGSNLPSSSALQYRVDQLIRNYRVRAHLIAQVDPLPKSCPVLPELSPDYYGFTSAHMELRFTVDGRQGTESQPLRKIIERMQNTYCRTIGVQFMHIDDLKIREWLQRRMETTENRIDLTMAQQVRILTRLSDAVIFEEFIQKKFVGAKRFSLEGAESLIPLLDLAIEKSGEQGIESVILGMAHRGRLNVLANIMGKSPHLIFEEFRDLPSNFHFGRGDVKYHLGYHSMWDTSCGKRVHLGLCFNPSHLEFVNTVAMGRLRAWQDQVGDLKRERGVVILIHGDAAFAGEGIVQETLNLSQLEGYTTGGTVHIVVNNQIGFTTGPQQARSCTYATDVAKMLQSPIFHVNGEDPEAVAQVVNLALDFRHEYKRDVVIDMYCYRKRGHNEGDEPTFTQPLLYQTIARRKSVMFGYIEHLQKLRGITPEMAEEIAVKRRKHLEKELEEKPAQEPPVRHNMMSQIWQKYRGGPEAECPDVDTAISMSKLERIVERLTQLPPHFTPNPKIRTLLEQRAQMGAGLRELDWATGEALAFGSLVTEGVRIRMTGQDCERGTFSHRHAVLHDYQNGKTYFPLQHLDPTQSPIEIINSPLSEAGVLGYEYGYSAGAPDDLLIWEAQFGDFANTAQVIIDQFIVSGEDKWRRLSGLVLLLPHGFDGQGPEHSSARLERFLSMAAEDNMQIVNVTTPAQYFHLLRRQVLRPWRKPLVVMSPKSLLRQAEAVSPREHFTKGTFNRVLPDQSVDPKSARRVILCSGKLYYELLAARTEKQRLDTAIVRLEQLYPLPKQALQELLSAYPKNIPVCWAQEEPENMGAWRFLHYRLSPKLLGRQPFFGVYRAESASPATGSFNTHKLEQKQLIDSAFDAQP